jgi:death-on-curing protein
MTRYLTLDEVLALHQAAIARYGGDPAIHDSGLVDSAVAQPRQSFGGVELHPTLIEKAAAFGFSLCSNHGFKDGNKRIGFLGMDAFLRVNGHKIVADTADAEAMFLGIASHKTIRDELLDWVRQHVATL